MSDFDKVMERLVTDKAFQAALAANPTSALAGYTLDKEERELLATQLVTGAGGERQVESRLTKSGVVGLVGPVAASLGIAAAGQAVGSAQSSQAVGSAPGGQAIGSSPGGEFVGAAPVRESVGHADVGSDSQAIGQAGPSEVVGKSWSSSIGGAPVEADGYRTYVDVKGDSAWDAYKAYERADGGVDIHADRNSDGVVDFVGHDYDRDGLIDDAEYDNDFDATIDLRMYDDNGDGWMDRGVSIADGTEPDDDGTTQGFGSAPTSS
jgi:hypothetical protein